jgi:signal transduction histidine kinase/CheY-like chemotaxis protein
MQSQNIKPSQMNSKTMGLIKWGISLVTLCVAAFLLLTGHHFIALVLLPVLGLFLLYLSQRQQLTALQASIGAVQAARTEAETAALEKTRVLATMSHEIRTPLNGVIGMLALLNDSELSPQQKNYGETAQSSARNLLSIIDEVLDTARSESRRKQAREAVDITSFVEGITELLAPRAHSKGIEVSARVAPDVPKELQLDELHLRQVLFNIAGNSIKFTEKGGVAIEVALGKLVAGSAQNISIRVRDSGIGMTKEEAAKIFVPYTQANDNTRARFGGTGLGLSISRELVSGMGGTLELETAPGKGSTFIIELPIEGAVPTPQAGWQPLTRRHYVLALPIGFAREHLALTLAELGADVSFVESAKELASQFMAAKPLQQFICGSQHAEILRKWAKKRNATSQAVVWVMLKPEERHNYASLLAAPFAGYLLSPLRRATLLAQLSSHDGRSLKQTGLALRAGKKSTMLKPVTALTILLAEDNPINALLCRTILEKAGHQVRVVGDGGEALDLMRSDWRCDIAVMDVEMPWVSGIKVAQLIRKGEGLEHRRSMPLLAMTGNVRPEDVQACLEAGFDEHLPKPFDRLDLEEKVTRLVSHAKAA